MLLDRSQVKLKPSYKFAAVKQVWNVMIDSYISDDWLQLRRLWLQKTPLAQDGSALIWDISASFL